MTSRRARRGAAAFVLRLSLVAALAATGCSPFGGPVHRSAVADGPGKGGQGAAEARRDAPPVVMFLGDSYTVGEGRVPSEITYASATARLLGWQVVVGGRSGDRKSVVEGKTVEAGGSQAIRYHKNHQ